MAYEMGYTGDGFTDQRDEDFAEQEACERAVTCEFCGQFSGAHIDTYCPVTNPALRDSIYRDQLTITEVPA